MASIILRPTSTLHTTPTDYQHWSGSVSPNVIPNYHLNVDEAVADDDTTYIQQNTATHAFEMFGMSSTGSLTNAITNVRFVFRIRSLATWGYCRAIVGTSTTSYSYGDTKKTTSDFLYVTHTTDMAVNPITGVAWAWDDFVNYYFGIEGWGSSTKANTRCTQFYIEITYTAIQTTMKGLIIKGLIIK